jgi:H-type lectin domain
MRHIHLTQRSTVREGKLSIQFAGSAFSGRGGKVSVDLLMDGNVIATASVFTNEVNSHKALVPVTVVISAAPGSHTFSVAPSSASTKVDQNDYFTVTVTEDMLNHFETATLEAGYRVTSGWTLDKPGAPRSGEREHREAITFSKTFSSPPEVMVAISGLDIDEAKNSRVRVYAQNITEEGFDLVFTTWDDTTLYTVRATWLAFGDAQ